jgi:hypothetical protein
MSVTCTCCGFPMDTPERAHAFIHQQGEALIEHRKELREAHAALDKAEQRLATLQRDNGELRGIVRDLRVILNNDNAIEGAEAMVAYVGRCTRLLRFARAAIAPTGRQLSLCDHIDDALAKGPNHAMAQACVKEGDCVWMPWCRMAAGCLRGVKRENLRPFVMVPGTQDQFYVCDPDAKPTDDPEYSGSP